MSGLINKVKNLGHHNKNTASSTTVEETTVMGTAGGVEQRTVVE
jgi:hypothetical protein